MSSSRLLLHACSDSDFIAWWVIRSRMNSRRSWIFFFIVSRLEQNGTLKAPENRPKTKEIKFDEDVLRLEGSRKTKNKSHHDDLWPEDEIIVKIIFVKKEVLVTLPTT